VVVVVVGASVVVVVGASVVVVVGASVVVVVGAWVVVGLGTPAVVVVVAVVVVMAAVVVVALEVDVVDDGESVVVGAWVEVVGDPGRLTSGAPAEVVGAELAMEEDGDPGGELVVVSLPLFDAREVVVASPASDALPELGSRNASNPPTRTLLSAAGRSDPVKAIPEIISTAAANAKAAPTRAGDTRSSGDPPASDRIWDSSIMSNARTTSGSAAAVLIA
jgi:hypothetical protein